MDQRWSRLNDEHRRNALRLERERPAPPPWWAIPLGFLVPWVPLGLWIVRPSAAVSTGVWFVLLIPLAALACLRVQRWQTVTVGLVFGVMTAWVVSQALLD